LIAPPGSFKEIVHCPEVANGEEVRGHSPPHCTPYDRGTRAAEQDV
jgi:hypothetical protein